MSRFAPYRCAHCPARFANPEERDEHEEACEPVRGYFVGLGHQYEKPIFVPDWRNCDDDF